MGVRKKLRAQQIKEEKKQMAFAKLTGCPTSPRKMRLVADLIRGVDVEKALQILKFNVKEASINLEKLLLSKNLKGSPKRQKPLAQFLPKKSNARGAAYPRKVGID